MLRQPGRYTVTLAAGLALWLGGCGGGGDEPTGDLASADPAPPAAAPGEFTPPPPANTEQAAPEAPGSGGPAPAVAETDGALNMPAEAAAAPAPAPTAEAPEAPAVAASVAPATSTDSGRRVENAAATDDLLQIAQAATPAAPTEAMAAAAGAPAGSGAPGATNEFTPPGESSGDPGPAMAAGPTSAGESSGALFAGPPAEAAAPGAEAGEFTPPGSESGMIDPGSAPGGEAAGLAGAPANGEPDYTTALKGAQTFLTAVRSKDVERIADAVALRSVSTEEGSAKYKDTFQAILDRSVDPQILDGIYENFKDMKIVGSNTVKSSGARGIIIGHQTNKHEFITRTLTMRREKAGWKVLDISGIRVQKTPNYNRNRSGQQTGR